MPNIKYYIDKNKNDKQGFVPIKANIAIDSKNHWKTIEKTKVRHWNPKKQRVIPNRETEPDNRHGIINSLLDEYQAKAKTFFNHCLVNNIPLTEKLIIDFLAGKEFKKKKNNDFNTTFQEFIDVTKTTKTLATLKNRTTVQKFLIDFQEYTKIHLTLHDIDTLFFDSLTDYAYNVRKTKNKYFAKITAVLKTFLNWAAERDYYTGTKHRKFQAPEKNIEVVCLTIKELQKLTSFKFENPKLDRVRDFYCFGCFTGLRFIDIKQLRREHLKNGYIETMIQKMKEPAKIPILPQAQKIIDKYDHPIYVLPQISNQKFNDYIKDCCKLAGINQRTRITTFIGNTVTEETKPKYELITAHTARKTFITLSFFLGMEVKIIKNITGHTQDKTFDKYLKIADEIKKRVMGKAWGKI
jgi:site-specific recombinase XerD